MTTLGFFSATAAFFVAFATLGLLTVPAQWNWSSPIETGLTLTGVFVFICVAIFLSAIFAGLIARFLPKELPPGIVTVGDLAEAVAALNTGLFAERHGAVRKKDVWSALVYVVRRSVNPNKKIEPHSRFYPER